MSYITPGTLSGEITITGRPGRLPLPATASTELREATWGSEGIVPRDYTFDAMGDDAKILGLPRNVVVLGGFALAAWLLFRTKWTRSSPRKNPGRRRRRARRRA